MLWAIKLQFLSYPAHALVIILTEVLWVFSNNAEEKGRSNRNLEKIPSWGASSLVLLAKYYDGACSMHRRDVYRVLIGKAKGKRSLRRHRHR
jgi:hypothetical protein